MARVSIQVSAAPTSGLPGWGPYLRGTGRAGAGLCRTLGLGLCCAALQGHATPETTGAAMACNVPRPAAPQAPARVAVWVDLSQPVPGTAAGAAGPATPTDGGAAATTALAMRQAVQAQQQAVASQLCALGATELARVTLVRNAIAVDLPVDALPLARQLPGVLRIRPVTHLHRVQPPGDAPPLRP